MTVAIAQRKRDQASRASLTGAERDALPWAIAWQPLWGIGGWVVLLDDQHAAWAHAHATFSAIGRALQLVTSIHFSQVGLTEVCFAPRPRWPSAWVRADWVGEGRGHRDRVGGQDAP